MRKMHGMSTARPFSTSLDEPASDSDSGAAADESGDLATNARLVPASSGPHQTPDQLAPHTDTTGPHQGE